MERLYTRNTYFTGPGLLRKPRVGEVLVSRQTGARLVVTRFDTNSPNIVHVRNEVTSRPSFFIWRFHDTLNRLVRHIDTAYPEEESP